MTSNKYNLSNLDVTVRNLSELKELEYRQFNDSARATAQRLIESLRGKSPDYQTRVADWVAELNNQSKKPYQAPANDRARDEATGRYVPNSDNTLTKGLENPSSKGTAFENLGERPSTEDIIQQALSEYRAKYEAAVDTANGTTPSPKGEHYVPSEPTEQTNSASMHWVMRKGEMVYVPRSEKGSR